MSADEARFGAFLGHNSHNKQLVEQLVVCLQTKLTICGTVTLINDYVGYQQTRN
jgi:hypothetical protein